MKQISFLILFLLPLFSSAQVEDKTETDCNGMSQSIYAIGDAGKPLVIASKGLDCSICMDQAGTVRDFAEANLETIAVWGAMTYLYSSDTPDCEAVDEWVTTYDWGSIFTFLDTTDYYFLGSTPLYYVINPLTHDIDYAGPSFANASNIALELVVTSGVSEDTHLTNSVTIFSNGSNLDIGISSNYSGTVNFKIINIVGQTVQQFQSNLLNGNNTINQDWAGSPGMDILSIEKDGKMSSHKFVIAK